VLKVLANATSYGIFAEMRREESAEKVAVTCYGIDATPFECRVLNPEEPGEYCFPPMASSVITAAVRLMPALIERCVTDHGGTYAMEDTDSMAIVATKSGGLIECPGGPYRKNGKPAIKALSWAHVNAIAERFLALSPYDRSAIPGSILKIEDDNFDPKTGRQRQLWRMAISAKRYALFVRDRNGEPELLREEINNKKDRYSEHGLGHLLNPTDPESDDRSWIAQAWLNIVRRSLCLPTKPLDFENRVAVLREYEFHPEAKCADSSGAPRTKQSVGLLGRRHVAIDSITYIGKESNRLQEVEEQSLLDPSDVYTEYPDPRRDEWATKILPKLKAVPLRELMEQTGFPRSTLQALRAPFCIASFAALQLFNAARKRRSAVEGSPPSRTGQAAGRRGPLER
jgi:hypothetical protein